MAADGAMRFVTDAVSTATVTCFDSIFRLPKTLIQLGYEPEAPIKCKGFTGKEGYLRLNAFKYYGFLSRQHGSGVLFTAFGARWIETTAFRYAALSVQERLNLLLRGEEPEDSSRNIVVSVATEATVLTIAHCAGAIVCHPFRVLGTRLIAELAGGPVVYPSNPVTGVICIYQEEGLKGLFCGLGSALLAEAAYASTLATLTQVMNEYVTPLLLDNKQMEHENQMAIRKMISHHLAVTLGNPIFYPFQVARTIMLVNGSGVGAAALTPEFGTTFDCLGYLSAQPNHRGLMRGSNLLRRFTYVE